MLKTIVSMSTLPFDALMKIYSESNQKNAAARYGDASETMGRAQAERDFYEFLQGSFFRQKNACYCIWLEQEEAVSALRLEPYRDGLLLEALETRPDRRGKGFAGQLLSAVKEKFPDIKIYSHIAPENLASIAVHLKNGFEKISDTSVYIDGSFNRRCGTYLLKKK